MALIDQLNADMKAAMRAREKRRLTVIRGMISEIKRLAIDEGKEALSEEEEIAFLSKQAKQRRESIESYRKADREDLVEQEQAELAIIEEYLPEQLSEEEAESKIRAIIERVGASEKSDLGKVMGPAMAELKGKFPGNEVKNIALRILS